MPGFFSSPFSVGLNSVVSEIHCYNYSLRSSCPNAILKPGTSTVDSQGPILRSGVPFRKDHSWPGGWPPVMK